MAHEKVFISHIHEDDAQVGAMKLLLSGQGFDVTDSSVTKDEPNRANNREYIQREILAPRIEAADTVIVLVSPGMRNSAYVNWEIEYASQLDRRVVGVWAPNGTEDDIPTALDDLADAMVGWQGERIKDAILGRINNWETSQGSIREQRPIDRHNC
ncbi:MAG: TIR domain-containing protein [Thermoleophilia bacterium]|nr:TIR domain-containing protein [Thermoleophilia bacterium]